MQLKDKLKILFNDLITQQVTLQELAEQEPGLEGVKDNLSDTLLALSLVMRKHSGNEQSESYRIWHQIPIDSTAEINLHGDDNHSIPQNLSHLLI